MRTINIKGKEYVPVNERVKEFRRANPDHTVIAEIITLDESSVVMKATVYDPDGKVVAVGHAQEDRGSSNINKTSYVENCETSAIGRALGMFGIGIDASMASADEVANAIDRQEALRQKVGKNNISALLLLVEEKGADLEKLLKYCEVEKVEDLTMEQWNNVMGMLHRKK